MLLRFFQAGEGLAVGATRSMGVDVRVIAAMHRDLEAAVELGSFREDFYYRLWGAVLEVPALRARREDSPLLAEHFRLRCNQEDQVAVDGFTRPALALLEADPWPGNVRELETVVRRAMAVRRRGVVGPEDVRLPALRRKSPAMSAPTHEHEAIRGSRYESSTSCSSLQAPAASSTRPGFSGPPPA